MSSKDKCPWCGSTDKAPIEDGWWCNGCSRDYPLDGITKCSVPECWNYAWYNVYCEKHGKEKGENPPRPIPDWAKKIVDDIVKKNQS